MTMLKLFRFRFQIVVLISVVFLNGCKSEFAGIPLELQDRSAITGVPCSAPCWYGLFPGTSTTKDVQTTVRSLRFIRYESERDAGAGYSEPGTDETWPAKLISYSCTTPMDRICVEFTLVNDTLKRIVVYPNYTVTLGQFIDALGNPDYISAVYIHTDPFCQISLQWESHQLSTVVADENYRARDNWCERILSGVKAQTEFSLSSVIYYSASWFEDLPQAGIDVQWEE